MPSNVRYKHWSDSRTIWSNIFGKILATILLIFIWDDIDIPERSLLLSIIFTQLTSTYGRAVAKTQLTK